jgi:hypothetical protein
MEKASSAALRVALSRAERGANERAIEESQRIKGALRGERSYQLVLRRQVTKILLSGVGAEEKK